MLLRSPVRGDHMLKEAVGYLGARSESLDPSVHPASWQAVNGAKGRHAAVWAPLAWVGMGET